MHAAVFFRSVRRGVGQNIFNMAGGGHPMGNLLKAPFTPNPLKASTADQQRMQFGAMPLWVDYMHDVAPF